MKKHLVGFTIMELLIVIAIIGIISIIFFENVMLSLKRTELNDAANQVASDFKRARSTSQRQSTNAVVNWPTNSTYTITQGTTVTSYKVPNGITVSCTGCTSNSFTYSAPYGEVTGITTGPVFTFASPVASLNTPATEVRVVGVTGKVVVGKNGL